MEFGLMENMKRSLNKFHNHEEGEYYSKVRTGVLEEVERTLLVVLFHEQRSKD